VSENRSAAEDRSDQEMRAGTAEPGR